MALVTVARLTRGAVAPASTLPTTVIASSSPGMSRLVTQLPSPSQLPWLVLKRTLVSAVGRESLTTMLYAAEGPVLETTIR